MTVTFDNDNDLIVYALEKIISYARQSQQIFVAQCVWCLASIIGLEQGLVNYIDNIQSRNEVTISSEEIPDKSVIASEEYGEDRKDRVLKECEEYLRDSRRLQESVALQASGKTKTGWISPLASTRQQLRVDKARSRVSRKSVRT
jgi:hypothetical protein